MKLCTDRRGIFIRTEYLSPTPGHSSFTKCRWRR